MQAHQGKTNKMKLSPHFSLHELIRSSTADRLGINNDTDDALIVQRLTKLCEEVLEPTRSQFGAIRPSSGFRCKKLNRAIGSKDTSQHVKGEAVDFEIAGYDNKTVAKWCRDNLEFDQLILEFYVPEIPNSGWIHISYADENRNEVLTINKTGVHLGILGEE